MVLSAVVVSTINEWDAGLPKSRQKSGCSSNKLYFPDLCLVTSTRINLCPGFGVGGKGSPLVTVLSSRVLPPLGPIISYCPDFGAFDPEGRDGEVFLLGIFKLLSF